LVLTEIDFLVAALRAKGGVSMRPEERRLFGEPFATELPFAGGILIKPRYLGLLRSVKLDLNFETRGVVPLGDGARLPLLGSVAGRVHHAEFSWLVGVETPFSHALGTFDFRGFVGFSYTPRVFDLDGDGFEDDVDPCPHQPEDVDGFADSDGCPDPDNDGDGVRDEQDLCPASAEDRDGHDDDDGCPDPDNDGDTIPDSLDPCPNRHGPTDPRYKRPGCPPKDRDGDHIVDDFDRCPRRAEDRDGFEDDDGCPDRDNDADGIRDRQDQCPNEAGPRCNKGCPTDASSESPCGERVEE
jgi:hypothetical protein